MPLDRNNGTLATLGAIAAVAVAGAVAGRRGSSAHGGKYGRFTRMPRSQVQVYLQSWGFAVYDDESLAELRQTAYENDRTEGGAQPPDFYSGSGWWPGKGRASMGARRQSVAAIEDHYRQRGPGEGRDRYEFVTDELANFMHYCDANDIDFELCMNRARNHHRQESSGS